MQVPSANPDIKMKRTSSSNKKERKIQWILLPENADVELSDNVNVFDTSYFFFCCAKAYIEVDVACFCSSV